MIRDEILDQLKSRLENKFVGEIISDYIEQCMLKEAKDFLFSHYGDTPIQLIVDYDNLTATFNIGNDQQIVIGPAYVMNINKYLEEGGV